MPPPHDQSFRLLSFVEGFQPADVDKFIIVTALDPQGSVAE